MRKYLIAFLAILTISACSFAQNPPTGYPPYGSFDRGHFDTVNLQDLNFMFSIPIVTSLGRGINFHFNIVYNSVNWVNSGGAWSPNPATTFGWIQNLPMGQTTYQYLNGRTICGRIDGLPYYTYTTTYDNYKYEDPFGTVHTFSTVDWQEVDNTCTGNDTISGTFTGHADDGSGYYINIGGSQTSPDVITPSGIHVGGGEEIDSNGNYISSTTANGETDWTDSAGHVALKVIPYSNLIRYEVLDPSGAYQIYNLNLGSYNIKTNFGCSGVTEWSGTESLPSSLDLPNGQSYQFTYEPTPGYSGYTTGRIQKVTLPTGGTIEYQYPGSNDGIYCSDGSLMLFNRTVSDGNPNDPSATWQYIRSQISGSEWQTTVTDPATAYAQPGSMIVVFNLSGQELQRVITQGTSNLRTINTTWASNGTPATRTTILDDGKTESEIETTFDSNGNLDLLKEHDWGSSAPGPVVRTTTINYLNTAPYNTTLNILDRPTSISVADASGTVQSLTKISYDQTGYINQSCPSGVPQNDSSCSDTTRGDPTSLTLYANASAQTGPLTQYFAYDSLGNVIRSYVGSTLEQQWSYSNATYYSFPDSETDGPSGGPQLTTSYTYNSSTGQLASVTDPNNVTTSYSYDYLKRLLSVTRPTGTTSYGYDDATPPFLTITSPVQSGDNLVQTDSYDGLGRLIDTEISDSNGNAYSFVQTEYDPLGRVYKVSNPDTGSALYWTETDYDALDRTTKVIMPDGSATTYAYSANTVTVTDPTGKQKKLVDDALGRTSAVYEPDPSNGNSLTNGTSYAYTVMDDLTSVTEGQQSRTYTYDGLGNLTSVKTPETANVAYQYQYNPFGLVTQRTDPRGVVTNYSYDSLNRLTQVSYNVGSTGVPATPTVSYTYGTNASQYNNGRLITMTDGAGTENYSYDALGRITQTQRTIAGQTYTTSYQYNDADELTSITYPSGRVVQEGYDNIGRLCDIDAGTPSCSSPPSPYASTFGYSAALELTGFKYGNGVVANYGYSADRLQMTSLSYTKGSSTLFSLGYSYGSSGSNNGQITGITDNVDNGRSVSYVYDALERITGATTVGSTGYPKWGLSWTYDRYGNRLNQSVTAGTGPSNSVSVDATTNRINTSGYGYDANGNMTNDGQNTLTYDAENRLVTASGPFGAGTYTYDGNGLRVKKSSGGATTVYVFSGTKVIAEYAAGAAPSSPNTEYIYSGSSLLAQVSGGTTTYFQPDQTSIRLLTNSSGSVTGQQGDFPFGESWYQQNATTKWQFTSYERDTESGNDYAMFRTYVNRLGRFSSPDPLGGDANDPQSLNRYPYVVNDPCNLLDPLGLTPCDMTSATSKQVIGFINSNGPLVKLFAAKWKTNPILILGLAYDESSHNGSGFNQQTTEGNNYFGVQANAPGSIGNMRVGNYLYSVFPGPGMGASLNWFSMYGPQIKGTSTAPGFINSLNAGPYHFNTAKGFPHSTYEGIKSINDRAKCPGVQVGLTPLTKKQMGNVQASAPVPNAGFGSSGWLLEFINQMFEDLGGGTPPPTQQVCAKLDGVSEGCTTN